MIQTSICIATHEKPTYLARVLESIFAQKPPFEYEVIVIDDGSINDETRHVCRQFPVHYDRRHRMPGYMNPAAARNMAYRFAQGEVIICQSDDTLHGNLDTIERLTVDLQKGEFNIATVYNTNQDGGTRLRQFPILTGPTMHRPLFFLGSLWRKDLYAVGGNDEAFVAPAYEDNWFADCLMHGLHLTPRYVPVVGQHLDHPRPTNLAELIIPSKTLYRQKIAAASKGAPWQASGGPWAYPGTDSITQWWDECHRSKALSWISGNEPCDVLEFLCVKPQAPQVVLDIGVGTGNMARDLTARGMTVDCLDISPVALAGVKQFSRCQYLPTDPLPAGEYNFALCHLVSQHVTDADLLLELRNVIAALKPQGLLAIQFADSPSRTQDMDSQKYGGICRSPAEATALIEKAGGVVSWQSPLTSFPNTKTIWFVLLAGKKQ